MTRSEVVSAQCTPVEVQGDAPVTRDKARMYVEVSAAKKVKTNVDAPVLVKGAGLKTTNPDPKVKMSHQPKHRGLEKKLQVAESGLQKKRAQNDRAGTLKSLEVQFREVQQCWVPRCEYTIEGILDARLAVAIFSPEQPDLT
ncbi:unnamed protein product [Echinostoma caproni]|uniref:Small vasohibin-binding protein n=1 Tax=Echinostoma caproni TaxID=27848 RepID=A0A183A450_9TREM|nr:unnamed protein product [Echinostoma caproni]